MAWKIKVDRKTKTKYYSIINKLNKQNKINKEFQSIISNSFKIRTFCTSYIK